MVQGLDDIGIGAKQALLARQPIVHPLHLEDEDKSELVVEGVEQDYVELVGLDGHDVAVEQALQALQPLQPPVQLILLEDYYRPDHYKQQVAQGQQKDLHYY
jgi:hypothetical protein